jgi:hypothetical protein
MSRNQLRSPSTARRDRHRHGDAVHQGQVVDGSAGPKPGDGFVDQLSGHPASPSHRRVFGR